VPKPTKGKLVEYTKIIEVMALKELCNFTL